VLPHVTDVVAQLLHRDRRRPPGSRSWVRPGSASESAPSGCATSGRRRRRPAPTCPAAPSLRRAEAGERFCGIVAMRRRGRRSAVRPAPGNAVGPLHVVAQDADERARRVRRLGVIESTFDPLPIDADVAREWDGCRRRCTSVAGRLVAGRWISRSPPGRRPRARLLALAFTGAPRPRIRRDFEAAPRERRPHWRSTASNSPVSIWRATSWSTSVSSASGRRRRMRIALRRRSLRISRT
jgi:hypothetical protein